MSFITEAERIGLEVVEAALGTVTGSASPNAPAVTVAGQAITFGQLATAATALHGSTIGGEIVQLVDDIKAGHGGAAVDDALDVTQQVAKILAPFVPVAGEVATAVFVLKIGIDFARTLPASTWAPAPRGGPPITEGGWSRETAPADNDPDNPSGAIGGAS